MNMYFSKIELRQDIDIQKLASSLMRNGYFNHQQIWQLFKTNKGQRDFLYRYDAPYFYVISQRPPKDEKGLWDIQIKEFAPKLTVGQTLAFSLRANPLRTHDHFDKNGKIRHIRHDVVMNEKKKYKKTDCPSLGELMQHSGWEWLEARMHRYGFEVKAEQLHIDAYQQHRLFKKGRKTIIKFSTLDFDGVLLVKNVETFLNTLSNGIGAARGFGCGMMLVRRCY